MDWQTKREEFSKALAGLEAQKSFMTDFDVRHFRGEGTEPQVDITDEIKADYDRLIANYKRLIAMVDETVTRE